MFGDSCTIGLRFSKSIYFNLTVVENRATCVVLSRNCNWFVFTYRNCINFAQLVLIALSGYALQLQLGEIRNLQNRKSGKDNRKWSGVWRYARTYLKGNKHIYIYIIYLHNTLSEVARDNALLVMIPNCPHHVVTCYINSLLTNKYL